MCQSERLAPGEPIPGVAQGCSGLLSGQVCESGFCNVPPTACGCQIDQDCADGYVCRQSTYDCVPAAVDAGSPDAGAEDASVADSSVPDASVAGSGLIVTPEVSGVATPGSYTFDVRLATQPTAPVRLTFTSNASVVLPPPDALTIAAASWNSPTTVLATTQGAASAFTGSIDVHSSSSDPAYDGLTATVQVSVLADPDASSGSSGSCSAAGTSTRSQLLPLTLLVLAYAHARRRRGKRLRASEGE
jgi:MYXO-CTERM domain-containing protein